MIIILQFLTFIIGTIITIPLFILAFKLFISDSKSVLYFNEKIEQQDDFVKTEMMVDTKNNKLISKKSLTTNATISILS